jgi:MFS family permease
MSHLKTLFSTEPRARRLLAVHAQSALGTGAAYVALLVIAYERFDSAFAVSAILLCELLPAILLGAVVGAAADRFERRTLLIAGDVVRAFAFLGLFLAGSFELTVFFALLAGAGQALFQPTVMAALPDVVEEEHVPAATGAYGAIAELGYVAGPILAAATFAFITPTDVLAANALTFLISALVLATIRFDTTTASAETEEPSEQASFLASIADGARALRTRRTAFTVVLSSTAFVCFLGAVNVAELLLVRDTFDGSPAQYSLVVAAMGLGIAAGSVLGSRGTDATSSSRHYLAGLLLCAVAMGACALAPLYGVVLVAFVALGVGNGVALVSENVLLQHVIPADMKGRVFGLKSSLISTSFAFAYFGGGAVVALAGPRAALLGLAAGSLLVWAAARTVLRAEERRAVPRTFAHGTAAGV